MKTTTFIQRDFDHLLCARYFTNNVSEVHAPQIEEQVNDLTSNMTVATFKINHSQHSFSRAKGRGISSFDIMLALEYGEVINKQGLFFYLVKRKNIPDAMGKQIADRINNLVVVTNNAGDTIVTCYKSKDASKALRKKSKILF